MPNQHTARVVSFEIRAPKDRNRLIGHYQPAGRILRLYHRGEMVTVNLAELDIEYQGNLNEQPKGDGQ